MADRANEIAALISGILAENPTLTPLEAIGIAEGRETAAEILEQKRISADAEAWASDERNLSAPREPKWDLAPERYALSLDGEHAAEFAKHYPLIDVLWVDSGELYAKLADFAKPSSGPWSGDHRSRSIVTAYRWSIGLGVTPPFVRPHENREILIQGGNHRLRLAHHYGAAKIPILVERHEAGAVKSILPSAHP